MRADWLVFSDRTLPASPSDFSGTHVVEDGDAEPAAERPRAAGQGCEGGQGAAEGHQGSRAEGTSRRAERAPSDRARRRESGEEADTDA